MIWSLLRFQFVRAYRSSTLATQIATTGLAALFAYIPIGGLLLLTGLGLPYVLREQGIDPVTAAESVILPALLCAAPFVAYVHRRIQAPLPALLSRPSPRGRLATALTVTGAMNVSMGVLTTVVICYWSTGVATDTSLVPAILWIVGGLVALAGFHFVCQLLRLTLHRSILAFGAAGASMIVVTLADSFVGAAWLSAGSAWLFSGVRSFDGIAISVLVASVSLLFAASQSWLRHTLYLDRLLGEPSKRRASRDFLRDLEPLIRTDLRLLLRNSRGRQVAANFFFLPVLSVLYIDLSMQPGQGYQLIFAGVWAAFANVNYLGISQRVRYRFMDGLAARPISFREMTTSVLRIADMATAACGAIAIALTAFLVPVGYVSVVAAIFLYVGGVVNGLCAYVSVIIRAPFEPQGGMFDFQGTPEGDQFIPVLLLNLAGLFPLGLILAFVPDVTHWTVITGIGGLGVIAIAMRGMIVDSVTRLHRRRRHRLMDSYREG